MRAWQATVQDEAGNVIFNPVVTVYQEDGSTLADIFNEDGTSKENPFTGTTEGFAQFWAERGTYKVVGANGGISETWQVDLADREALEIARRAHPFNSRIDAETDHIPADIEQINIKGVNFVRDPDGTALETADGAMWSPLPDNGGSVPLEAWGVVYGDRSAAAANGMAINRALAFCAAHGVGLYLGAGVIFNSVPIIQSGRVHVTGAGMGYWQKQYANNFSPQATTAIVMVGAGPKDQTLFGVSSCRNWGAGRDNPSARAGYNDDQYRLTSFVNESASASDRSLRPLSVAWTVQGDGGDNQAVWGSSWREFRIMPDAGGDDGMLDIRSSDRAVTKPLSAGDWDIGFMLRSARQISMTEVQAVGQWRIGGMVVAPHAKSSDMGAAAYETSFHGCIFNRLHIRSVDSAPVVATTATTVDIPWADDHPFGADGDNRINLSQQGRAGVLHTFSGMERIPGGDYDILRLTGVSPDPTADPYRVARVDYRGGGTSEMKFENCQFQGFGHGSQEPAENVDMGGVGLNYFTHPQAIIEISGNEITELNFCQSAITGYETVAVHMHDCRNIILPRYWEMNYGGRIIGSPARNSNAYSVCGFAATETMQIDFEPSGSTIENGSLDMRPYITEMVDPPLFNAPGDDGFFEAVRLRSVRFSAASYLDIGAAANIAPKGGRSGLGRMNGPTDFFNPSPNDIDYALYYDDVSDVTRVRKAIHSNTLNQADIGSSNRAFGSVWGSGLISTESNVNNDTVMEFAPRRTGGWLMLTVYGGEAAPLVAYSAIIFFDVGASLLINKANLGFGGSNVDVVTTDVTGTTGEEGKITVAVQPGVIKIENRRGSSSIVRLAILG